MGVRSKLEIEFERYIRLIRNQNAFSQQTDFQLIDLFEMKWQDSIRAFVSPFRVDFQQKFPEIIFQSREKFSPRVRVIQIILGVREDTFQGGNDIAFCI